MTKIEECQAAVKHIDRGECKINNLNFSKL